MRRPFGLVAALAAAMLFAGCASRAANITTSNEPAAPVTFASPTSGRSGEPTPDASATAPGQTGTRTAPAPSAAASPTTTAPATTAAAGASPSAVAPPKACPEDETCAVLAVSEFKGSDRIVLRQGRDGAGEDNVTVVELTQDGALTAWDAEPDTYQPHMTCSTKTEHLHCVVVWGIGAHGSVAQLYIAENGRFTTPDPVITDTPGSTGVDLDGDGDLDLIVPINDGDPSYAGGSFYWETMELTHGQYHSTGCTSMSRTDGAAPKKLVTGPCPSGQSASTGG